MFALAIAAVISIALCVTLPALGDLGLLSGAEIPAWKRARAANGAELDGLLRQPALPEWLRAQAYALAGTEWGLRLPSALAHAGCGALALALARRLGFAWPPALLVPLFFWAFPLVALGSRAAQSSLIGEFFIAAAILSALWARSKDRERTPTLIGLALCVISCVAASASVGIAYGAALPLGVLALSSGRRLPSSLRWIFGIAGTSLGLVALQLAMGQGEGYIPLLSASADQYLIDRPERRELTAAFEEFGHHIFPFAILVVLGMVAPGAAAHGQAEGQEEKKAARRLPALWTGLGLCLAVFWSAKYGRHPFPISIPAALCCASAVSVLLDAARPHRLRRFALVVILCGLWVVAKDGERTPSRIGSPLHHFTHEARYPEAEIGSRDFFAGWVRWAWLSLLAAYTLSPNSSEAPRPGRLGRLEELPGLTAHRREQLPWFVIALALGHQCVQATQSFTQASSEQLSLRSVFARHRALVDAGTIPREVGLQRIRDLGLPLYGPPEADSTLVPKRKELLKWLKSEEPRVAMIRRADYAGIHQNHRQEGWPLHVLDWSHHDLKLVSNHMPEGLTDVAPLSRIVYDALPKLEHETFVRFDEKLELVGWQVEGDIRRGGEVTVTLGFHVLRALTGATQIYVRLQQGQMSKINVYPHDPAEGLYAGNYWRKGDYIVDRFTFVIPAINTIPGPHDLFIGIAKSKKAKLEITLPEERTGEFGVKIRGRKDRFFAVIATIDL